VSRASDNLRTNQRQLDMDGCEVGVSRQAVEETLAEYDDMLAALRVAWAWMPNPIQAYTKDASEESAQVEAVILRAAGITS
jgi:hypothetical protein